MFQQTAYQSPKELGHSPKPRIEQDIKFSLKATSPYIELVPQYFYLLKYNLHRVKYSAMKSKI